MNQRYYSLDVFRGATVALMILVNNPGSWAHIYSPLKHATWHGCTPTDLVFPFFLFAVGNAMAFVMPKFREKGTSFFLTKVVRRTLLILAIGVFLNWSPFIQWKDNNLVGKNWENIRVLGVLQRIALAYFFASLIIYLTKTRTSQIIVTGILIGYWLLCSWLGDKNDPYSLSGFFGTEVDKQILGENHMYKGEGIPFDPEGLTSTIASIVQVILGYYTGKYIRENGKNFESSSLESETNNQLAYKMLTHLFIAGSVLIFVAFCWDFFFPINKKIWTSSYVLYTTGLALMVLGILIYIIEFKQVRGAWSRFFDVFGKNPLFIFFLSGFLPRILALCRWVDHYTADGKPVYISAFPWFYEHICKPLFNNFKNGSLMYAFCMIAFYWTIVYFLDKKKIYIKV